MEQLVVLDRTSRLDLPVCDSQAQFLTFIFHYSGYDTALLQNLHVCLGNGLAQ